MPREIKKRWSDSSLRKKTGWREDLTEDEKISLSDKCRIESTAQAEKKRREDGVPLLIKYHTEEEKIQGARDRRYRWEENHPLQAKACKKQSKKKFRPKQAIKDKERLLIDPCFKLKMRLRSRLKNAVIGDFKNGSAVQGLGCSIDEFKLYIQARFADGMTWDNWTTDGWHMDHIKPLASFDLTDRAQFLTACNFTNLQPLWALDNLSKGAKII